MTEDTVAFRPSDSQRRCKALYWVKVDDMSGTTDCTVTQAVHLTGEQRLYQWWDEPGFKDWFALSDSWKVELNLLMENLVVVLTDIFANDDPRSNSAKVAAARFLADLLGKMPNKDKNIKYLDEQVSKMNRQQLEAFIKSTERALKPVPK